MNPAAINVTPFHFANLLEQVVENRDRVPPLYLVTKKETDGLVYVGMCDLKAAKENGYQKMTFQEINAIAQSFLEHISGLEENRRKRLVHSVNEPTEIDQLKLQQLLNAAKDITLKLTELGKLRIKKIDLAKQKANSWTTFTVQVFSTLSIVGWPIAYYISRTKTTLKEQYQSALSDVIKERVNRMLQSSYELILNLRQVAIEKNEETCPRILERLEVLLKQAGDGLILEPFAKSIEEGLKFVILSPAKDFTNKYASVETKLAKTKGIDSPHFREGFVKEQVLDILTAVSDDYQVLKWLTAIQAVCLKGEDRRISQPDDIQALKTLFSLQQMSDDSFFAFESNLGTHSFVISEEESYKVTVNEDPDTLRIRDVKIDRLCCLRLQERLEAAGCTSLYATNRKFYYLSSFNLSLAEGKFNASNLTREFLTEEELIRKKAVELVEHCKEDALKKSHLNESVIAKGIEIELQNIQKGLFFNSFENDLKQGLAFRIYDTESLFQNYHATLSSKLEQTQEEDSSKAKILFVEEQVAAIRQATSRDPHAESWLHAVRSVCQFKQLVDVETLKELLEEKQIQMLSDFEWINKEWTYKVSLKEDPHFKVTVHRILERSLIQHLEVEIQSHIRIIEQMTHEGKQSIETDISALRYTCSFNVTFNGETFEVKELKRAFIPK